MPTKTNKRPIEPLTKAEFVALLTQATIRGTTGGRRDAALIALLGGAGLRLQEALSLQPRDLDERTGKVNVRRGKGSKQRVVACIPDALVYVRDWLNVRAKLGITKGPIICGFSKDALGQPMAQQHVARMLKLLAKRAKIEKRVHPHGLRHSLTLWLAEAREPIHYIKAVLGHSSLQVTDKYLSVIFPEQVIGAMNRLSLDLDEDE